MSAAPIKWMMPRMRCAAKKRSAIRPTIKGAMIAPSDCVPYANPFCTSDAFKLLARNVPMVTYQAPQIKNSRNIINESCKRVVDFMCGEGFYIKKNLEWRTDHLVFTRYGLLKKFAASCFNATILIRHAMNMAF